MKTTFNKFSISVLSLLGLIGVSLLIIPSISKSEEILMPSFALICFFLFGIYYSYLKNKQFLNKDSRIFPLFSHRIISVFSLGFSILLIGVILFAYIQKGSTFGLFSSFSAIIFSIVILVLFPYRSGNFIMIDNNGIYAPKIGYLKWELIKTYKIEADLMLVDIELIDNEKKLIAYNKYVDIELLKNELQTRINTLVRSRQE